MLHHNKAQVKKYSSLGLATTKEYARRSEAVRHYKGKAKQAKMKPRVHHREDTLSRSEEVHRKKAILLRDKGSIDQKVTRGFSAMKNSGLEHKTSIFEPTIGQFSNAYKQ